MQPARDDHSPDRRGGVVRLAASQDPLSVLDPRLRKISLEVRAGKPGLGKLRPVRSLLSSDVGQTEYALAKLLMDEADTTGIDQVVKVRQKSVACELAELGEDAELVIGSGTGGIEPGTARNQVVHYTHCPVALHKKRTSLPSRLMTMMALCADGGV